jgi:hypothetical protein
MRNINVIFSVFNLQSFSWKAKQLMSIMVHGYLYHPCQQCDLFYQWIIFMFMVGSGSIKKEDSISVGQHCSRKKSILYLSSEPGNKSFLEAIF